VLHSQNAFGEMTKMAIRPLKVIQGHQFWHQLKFEDQYVNSYY